MSRRPWWQLVAVICFAAAYFAACKPVQDDAVGLPCTADGGGSNYALSFREADSIAAADRILIPLLDGDGRASNADIGRGSFTIELWLKGNTKNQIRPSRGFRSPGESVASFDWTASNIFLDRSVYHSKYPVFGAGIHRDGDVGDDPATYARAVIRFGVRSGSRTGFDDRYTIQGSRHVLDGAWHHVALVRNSEDKRLAIVVDGVLDVETAGERRPTSADLSYPQGAESDPDVVNPQRSPYIVLGTEKHDLGSASPGFRGTIDEIRLWRSARTVEEIRSDFRRSQPADVRDLVAFYRLESGDGTILLDSTGGVPAEYSAGRAFLRRSPWTRDAAPIICDSAANVSKK